MEYGEWPLEASRNLDKAKIAIPPNNILRISMKPNISGKPYKKDVLAGTSNLMIWSDNDVANDFTTMKNESGEQAYHPKFMVCGMEAYKVRLFYHYLCKFIHRTLVVGSY